MYSQLTDRVFTRAGTSYLVLHRDTDAPDWLWVKAINPAREVLRMHHDEIQRCLANPAAARAGGA